MIDTLQRMMAQTQIDNIRRQLAERTEQRRKLMSCDNCGQDKIMAPEHVCDLIAITPGFVGYEDLGRQMGVGHH